MICGILIHALDCEKNIAYYIVSAIDREAPWTHRQSLMYDRLFGLTDIHEYISRFIRFPL